DYATKEDHNSQQFVSQQDEPVAIDHLDHLLALEESDRDSALQERRKRVRADDGLVWHGRWLRQRVQRRLQLLVLHSRGVWRRGGGRGGQAVVRVLLHRQDGVSGPAWLCQPRHDDGRTNRALLNIAQPEEHHQRIGALYQYLRNVL